MSGSKRASRKAGSRKTEKKSKGAVTQKHKENRPYHAYLANRYQEMRIPVNAIISYSKMLLEDASEQEQKNVIHDLQKIHSLGKQLLALVDENLDNKKIENSRTENELGILRRNMRHAMRTPLNAIIGYSEMLMENAQENGQESMIPDLDNIVTSGKRFLTFIDDSEYFPEIKGSSTALERSDMPFMIQSVINDIRPLEENRLTVPAGDKGSLLIVDDNEINRDLLSRQLQRQGHAVTVAEGGRHALEKMKDNVFDIILLDVMMPDINGFQVLQRLKSHDAWRDIPVIVISALDEMDSVVQCIQLGAEDYLLKPFNPVLLKARIKMCLENKRLKELSDALELKTLKEEVQIIAESRAMQNVLNTVRTVSRNPVNVLIHGESGTGKEVIARMIHKGSDRKDKPFVAVNCASIPENLMESEFFGYEKGAFTGADFSRGGRFEEADGGTLFLDEIGDMPLVIQPKFLRVIQEGEGKRLGSSKPVRYDMRIISASNKDIRAAVASETFREDLFYRIFSVEISIPSLRERREDIAPLAIFFMNKVSKRFRKKIAGFSQEVLNFFEDYPWPGNVRQLLHEVERLVALTPEGKRFSLKHCSEELHKWRNLRSTTVFESQHTLSLTERVEKMEITCIKDALQKTGGNKLQAAKLLGITRQGLDKKIKRYNISLPLSDGAE